MICTVGKLNAASPGRCSVSECERANHRVRVPYRSPNTANPTTDRGQLVRSTNIYLYSAVIQNNMTESGLAKISFMLLTIFMECLCNAFFCPYIPRRSCSKSSIGVFGCGRLCISALCRHIPSFCLNILLVEFWKTYFINLYWNVQ